jgi:hypothetical protein
MANDKKQRIIICYSNFESFQKNEQIMPKDFLSWAKSDLKEGNKRSLGNTLGNIKKALHSRIDEIIKSTHITYAKDWDWKKVNTDTKLLILKKMGIAYIPIAKVITDIRNKYEHQYILPTKDRIEADYGTAELWLNDSYQKYGCNRIGIVNLLISDISQANNEITKLAFPRYANSTYFWDYKKAIVKTKKDGSLEIQKLDQLTWNDILNIEKGYIKALSKSKNYYYLPQKKMTNVFHFCNRKIPRKIVPFFSITLNLKEEKKRHSLFK